MANTFNRDFERALESKLALQASTGRQRDADAGLSTERARMHAIDIGSAAAQRTGQANLYNAQAGVTGRIGEAEANLADQRARSSRIGTNIDLGKGLYSQNTDFFLQSDKDLEGGGIDSPAFSYGGSNTFGDRIRREGDTFSNYADGGMVRAVDPGMVSEYELYRSAAEAAGVPALPMQEAIPRMAQARAQKRQQVMDMIAKGGTTPQGYAEGGEIDGPGTGKSDSIPAVIDGAEPAAVSDGEFHIPKHVVDYYGTKMLDGLVEKARQAGKATQRKQQKYACGGKVKRHGYAEGGAVKKAISHRAMI